MLNGTGDVHREFTCSERLKDEVEKLLKLSFSVSDQLLHCVSTHKFSVVQIQVIIFDSHYCVVGQSDCSEILLILYLFHNCTCIHVIFQFDVQHYVTFTQYKSTLVHSFDNFINCLASIASMAFLQSWCSGLRSSSPVMDNM